MNKIKKQVLATGIDNAGVKYFYACPKCRTLNPLNAGVCSHCGKKRPRNAFEYARKEQPVPVYGRDIDRTARNAYPAAPQPCFAVPLPANANYHADNYVANGLQNLPVYYATDEYGRVYRAKVKYGAMPCSAPVPVATPTKHIQTPQINVNLNQ